MPRSTLNPEIKRAIANNIRELLKKEKMTQERLAHEVGVTYATVNNIVTEKTSIELATLIKIAKVFDTTLDALVN